MAPNLAPEARVSKEVIAGAPARQHPNITHLVPWFIIGFLVMVGLGFDIRAVARAGGRVTIAAILSLAALGLISFGLLAALNLSDGRQNQVSDAFQRDQNDIVA
jgi:uncharacterized membrane protein YadS